MELFAEQHLLAAKLVRANGARRTGLERELFIRKSNTFLVCARLTAQDGGGICLSEFDWSSLTPDWSLVDELVLQLASPHIEAPPPVPIAD